MSHRLAGLEEAGSVTTIMGRASCGVSKEGKCSFDLMSSPQSSVIGITLCDRCQMRLPADNDTRPWTRSFPLSKLG